jgi:glycine oxidase
MTSSDVIIIGGGVIGLASAWRLAQAGLGVRLFEKGRPGAEASSAALGVLLAEGSSGSRVENTWAALTQASLELYPAVAAQLHDQTGVDVELRDEGVLDIALDSSELAALQEELAFQQAAGIPVTFLTSQEVRQLEPALGPQVRGGLHFSAARQVDNVRLCTALTLAARQAGVAFHSGEAVTGLIRQKDRVAGVRAGAQAYSADRVVVAAGSWSGMIEGLSLPVRPAKGQALALEAPFVISHVLQSSTGYIAPRRDGRLLIGATVEEAGFDKRSTAEGVRQLLDQAIHFLPALKGATLRQTWAGLRPRAGDDLPILGPMAGYEGLIIATGHFRKGILLAPITAQLVVAWVTGIIPALDVAPFSPDRFAGSGK